MAEIVLKLYGNYTELTTRISNIFDIIDTKLDSNIGFVPNGLNEC